MPAFIMPHIISAPENFSSSDPFVMKIFAATTLISIVVGLVKGWYDYRKTNDSTSLLMALAGSMLVAIFILMIAILISVLVA